MKYFLFFLFISLTIQSTPAYAADLECIDPATLAPKYVGTEYLIFTGTSLKTEELAIGMQTYALETVQVDTVAQGKVSGTITIKYAAHQSLGFGCSGGPGVPASTNVYVVERTATGTYIGTQRLLPTDYAAKILEEALARDTSTSSEVSSSTPSIIPYSSSTVTISPVASTTINTEPGEHISLLQRLVGLLNELVGLLSR